MQKYRKKPVVIEAVQFKSGECGKQISDIQKFVGTENMDYDPEKNKFFIETPEGRLHISEGDYIIKGVEGEFYPCKPDIFHQTYEKVEEANNE